MHIETPHFGRFRAQKVVRIHITAPRAELRPTVDAALAEITAALHAQNLKAAGRWFAFHHRRPTNTYDLDVCVPVSEPAAISGRLAYAELPEFEVVRTAYHGSYEGLPSAWPEFLRWAETKGHKVTNQAIGQFAIGPEEVADPQSWQTDLMLVLHDGEVSKDRIA